MFRGAAVALFVACVLTSGCGETYNAAEDEQGGSADKGRKLSIEQLRALDFPAYWVGPTYRRLKVADIRLFERRGVAIRYGKKSCDPGSGCSYPADVFSRRTRRDVLPIAGDTPDGFGGLCFRKIGRAVQVSCLRAASEDGEDILLTGEGSVIFNSVDPADLHSATRPNGRRPPPPTRLTCAEVTKMPDWARRKVPRRIGPGRRCS